MSDESVLFTATVAMREFWPHEDRYPDETATATVLLFCRQPPSKLNRIDRAMSAKSGLNHLVESMRFTSPLILLILVATGLSLAHAGEQVSKQVLKESESMRGYQPADGFVPDRATAIAIAVAVWEPVYGKKTIAEEVPYQATLKNGNWTVTGTLPKGRVGGTATAVIDKMSGRIIKMYHTK